MNTGNNNGKSTILIVDDDDAFSSLLQRKLSSKGFKTARTSNKTETIDWLTNNNADLMLLDHGLGNTTSKKLIEKLKKQNLQTPFVIVSGQEDQRVVADMMNSGALDYVVKNAELLDVLPATIKRAIDKCKHDIDQKNLLKKIEALAKFPDENPNPVLRVSNDGTLLYNNNASLPLLKEWKCRQGQKLTEKWQQFIYDVLKSNSPRQIEIDCSNQLFSLTFAPIADAGYVNIYALDMTEEKRYKNELQKSYKLMENKVKERTLQLQKTVKDLQNEVVERIKDEAIIVEDQKQLRKMASELMLIEERERREIAHALHDSIGQILAFATIELGAIISKTDKKSAKPLKKIRHNIEKAITETRKLTYDLSPAVLYSFGLNPALEHLAEQFATDHDLPCSFNTDNRPINISTEVELFLYRSVRELLINTAKHAKATEAVVKTRLIDDNLEISVSDDGLGFDLFSVNVVKGKFNSIGLLSIKERLTHIGGSLKIYSMPGRGTVITMLTPVEKQDLDKEKKQWLSGSFLQTTTK